MATHKECCLIHCTNRLIHQTSVNTLSVQVYKKVSKEKERLLIFFFAP